VDVEQQVLRAASARAAALTDGDASRLRELLHPDFRWTSHQGQTFDLDAYVEANTGGTTVWRGQTLTEAEVIVVDDVAVLRCTVEDTIDGADGSETFRMPMTQVWVRMASQWKILAGHAGPRQL
jgi:hypothetical protein